LSQFIFSVFKNKAGAITTWSSW